MPVLLRVQRQFPDGTTHDVPMLYPTGRVVEKAEREQAERLDGFLAEKMPAIAQELSALGLLEANTMPKWHAVGQRLAFVDDPNTVAASDRDSGAVWLAVRQHCPAELLPKGEEPLTPNRMTKALQNIEDQRRLGKKHDHFERCYKLGKLNLEDVKWMTWSDFDAFLESPGLERDPRILPIVGETVAKVGHRPTRAELRRVFKALRVEIPTKHRERDTSSISERDLRELVLAAFSKASIR